MYLAGMQVQRYMTESAVQYDYILGLRLDTSLWGTIPPLDPSAIPAHGLVVRGLAFQLVWYSLLHDDTLHRLRTAERHVYGHGPALRTGVAA